MAIVIRKSENEKDNKRIKQFCVLLNKLAPESGSYDMISYLESNLKYPDNQIIRPNSLVADLLDVIYDNKTDFQISNYINVFKDAEKIYEIIFFHAEETPDFDSLRVLFLELFDKGGIYSKNLFNRDFYGCFANKINYIRFFESVKTTIERGPRWASLLNFAISIREFYFDDDSFMAALKRFYCGIMGIPESELNHYTEMEKNRIYKMNGIYDVTASQLATVDYKIQQIEALITNAEALVKNVEAKEEVIKKVSEEAIKTIKATSQSEIDRLINEINAQKNAVNAVYDKCLEQIHEGVRVETNKLLEDILRDSKDKLDTFSSEAQRIYANTTFEIAKISADADNIVSRIKTAVYDDQAVTEIVKHANENKVFLDKINSIAVASPAVTLAQPAPSMTAQAPVINKVTVKTDSSNASTETIVINEEDDKPVDYKPVYLLDDSIPFSDKYTFAMKKKAEMVKNGAYFHERFDDILTAVIENANPYLIGPSGCGKTFLVKQLADILGVDLTDIGYINEEYDILGFQTANGSYSKPNFYRCYKYGGIAFCDELDNGNAKASVKLNSFLSNTDNAYFCFPNGEIVKRHPNFRLISAGNTAGNGADSNYNSREKIEESVMQRLMPIYVNYDNQVESKILSDYPNWFKFVALFREATDSWHNTNGMEASGIITTRDTARIRRYLDDKSFSTEKIIKYQFVQTKDIGYLSFLSDYMMKNNKDASCLEMIKIFNNYLNECKKNGGHVK